MNLINIEHTFPPNFIQLIGVASAEFIIFLFKTEKLLLIDDYNFWMPWIDT